MGNLCYWKHDHSVRFFSTYILDISIGKIRRWLGNIVCLHCFWGGQGGMHEVANCAVYNL